MIRETTSTLPTVTVDEIPTNPSTFKARVVAIAVASLAGLAAGAYYKLPQALEAFLSRNARIEILFESIHADTSLALVFQLFGPLAILCAAASISRRTPGNDCSLHYFVLDVV